MIYQHDYDKEDKRLFLKWKTWRDIWFEKSGSLNRAALFLKKCLVLSGLPWPYIVHPDGRSMNNSGRGCSDGIG